MKKHLLVIYVANLEENTKIKQFKAEMAFNARYPDCLEVMEPLTLAILMKYKYISKENPDKTFTSEAIIENNSQFIIFRPVEVSLQEWPSWQPQKMSFHVSLSKFFLK